MGLLLNDKQPRQIIKTNVQGQDAIKVRNQRGKNMGVNTQAE